VLSLETFSPQTYVEAIKAAEQQVSTYSSLIAYLTAGSQDGALEQV